MNERNFPAFTLTRPVTVTADSADLDASQVTGGVPLPPSYRDFAEHLGYGRLFNRLILYIPMGNHPDSFAVRSSELARFFREGIEREYFEYEPDGSPELVRRLIPFGISEDGHYFAWDPAEPTGAGEHMIFAIGSKMLSVTRAARNLYELLHGCTDTRIKRILGPGYQPLQPVFAPLDKG